jgi:microcin C transport system substrate-binding protein
MTFNWYRTTARTLVLGSVVAYASVAYAQETIKSHGISAYGDLKYPADYKHFEYVNPDAPQGGTLTLRPSTGGATFDSFNNYILKGARVTGLGLLSDSLLTPSADEPDSSYLYMAESMEYPEDRSWVTFKIRKDATFSDGVPITAHDVVFTRDILIEKGHPFYKNVFFKEFESIEALDDHTVKFSFKEGANTRDLPQYAGGLAILPKHYWADKDFGESGTDIPVGSGGYTIADFEPGLFVKYCKIDNYWAKDHPANVGTGNFDCIRYEYFKDGDVSFEAFKSGAYLVREENTSKKWKTQYDFPAVKTGLVKTEELPDGNPQANQGIWMNLRKAKFQNIKTREALQHLFNFEWTNKTVFYDSYSRSDSFWENSPMQAEGMITPEELALLEPYRDQLIPSVFDEPAYVPPVMKQDKFDRRALRAANKLLAEAGWKLDKGVLKDENGQPLTIEFIDDNDDFLHILTPIIDTMKRAGIDAKFKQIDRAQMIERAKNYDYDVLVRGYSTSLSPGEEIAQLYGSVGIEQLGGANTAGFGHPAVDDLIKKVGAAKTREEMHVAVRAIDRVLRAYHIRIPNWYLAADRLAYWDVFGRPDIKPEFALGVVGTWWFDQDKYDDLVAKGAFK